MERLGNLKSIPVLDHECIVACWQGFELNEGARRRQGQRAYLKNFKYPSLL